MSNIFLGSYKPTKAFKGRREGTRKADSLNETADWWVVLTLKFRVLWKFSANILPRDITTKSMLLFIKASRYTLLSKTQQ